MTETATSLVVGNSLSEFLIQCDSLGRAFEDSDMTNLDLRVAAIVMLEKYNDGSNSFLMKMKSRVTQKRELTFPQGRAVLNIFREMRIKGLTVDCNDAQPIDLPDPEVPVIAVQTSTNLDLSLLPDGRYAAPDFSGKQDLVFLMVRRVRKGGWRDRRYVYGKIRTGREYVDSGTIEVKEWSSDSKRLCGQQKPGETYAGEFEQQIEMILAAPEGWAKLFGLMVGHCYICGKTLTDEESRGVGIGPECVKKNNYFTSRPTSYIKGATV